MPAPTISFSPPREFKASQNCQSWQLLSGSNPRMFAMLQAESQFLSQAPGLKRGLFSKGKCFDLKDQMSAKEGEKFPGIQRIALQIIMTLKIQSFGAKKK